MLCAELPFRGLQHGLNRIFLREAFGRLRATAGQALLQTVFLAHQAWVDTDGVIRTLFRLFVTRRTMLEWETAATADRQGRPAER